MLHRAMSRDILKKNILLGIDPELSLRIFEYQGGGYKDGRIVKDMALGIYPNSVYALYTCI